MTHDPYPRHAPPPPTTNGLGTASLALGIVGLALAFVPLIGVIAWPLVLTGIGLGIAGLLRASRTRAPRGTSLAGLILSVLGLLVCIVALTTTAPAAPWPAGGEAVSTSSTINREGMP